jgi:DivIVA domain-containing protein
MIAVWNVPERARTRLSFEGPRECPSGAAPRPSSQRSPGENVEALSTSVRTGVGHTRAMAAEEPAQSDQRERELTPSEPEQGHGFSELELRVHVPAEIRDPSFPLEMRGYSRRAVDAYIKRVNHLIAELEVSRSPRAAVRHALDRLTEQVGGILQRARETAEEITSSARDEAKETTARASAEAAVLLVNSTDEADQTRAEGAEILTKAKAEVGQILARARAEAEEALTRSRAEAEDTLTRSRAEAEERLQRSEKEFAVLQELAEARLRELHTDTEALWGQRRELLDDMGRLAAQLEEAAREAAARLPSLEPVQRAEESTLEPAAAEPEPTGVAVADEQTGAMPAAVPDQGGHDQKPA